MLFIVEKRGVAFSASFWYLGGAYVQYVCIYIYAVQSKKIHMYHYLDKYMYINIYIHICVPSYQQTSWDVMISKEQSRTSFCVFSCCSGDSRCWAFQSVHWPRWAKNWNGEPGASPEEKRNRGGNNSFGQMIAGPSHEPTWAPKR